MQMKDQTLNMGIVVEGHLLLKQTYTFKTRQHNKVPLNFRWQWKLWKTYLWLFCGICHVVSADGVDQS